MSKGKILAQQSGVSLIWVLTVILVLLIVSGAALLAVSSRLNITVVKHQKQQAHYTAHSTLDTVSRWIVSGYEPGASAALQKNVKDILAAAEGEGGIDYPLQNLDSTLGECTLHLEYTDEKKTSLKLTATATFADSVETLSMTMQRGTAPSSFDDKLKPSDFSPNDYKEEADRLDKLQSEGVVALYESSDTYTNLGFNDDNLEQLNKYINDPKSNLEARWTNSILTVEPSDRTSSSSNNDKSKNSNVLGTETNGSSTDGRRFRVPMNGRITIDPLERDGYEGRNNAANTAYATGNNTRVVALAIDNTAEKDVLFRLASGSAATGTSENQFISTVSNSRTTQGTITNTVTKGAFHNWSAPRYASLITLDFTDNAGRTEDLTYRINDIDKTYTWHPNNWNKMDLFVQSDGKVSSNLAFGPFAHKDGITLDYDSDRGFVDNWNGTTKGEARTLWNVGSSTSYGIPYFPVDFGENAHFWILDSPRYEFGVCYVWFMQGTNILGTDKERSSIYSTRSTVIGGALTRSSSGRTTDGLNRELNGFADRDISGSVASYVETTVRYSQLICNTDIVLMPPPSGSIAGSKIRRPNTWQDRTNLPSSRTNAARVRDVQYNPTMAIKGGTIYVGRNQSLVIEGAVLDNMWINPNEIVVAAGGELTIQKSAFTNVLTDIYVEGGTLNIDEGAKIKGNIYAYNSGKVNVKGSFQLLSPHDDGNDNVMTEDEVKDGIFIYGDQLVDRMDGITLPGTLTLPATGPDLVTISGSSNKVHILGTVDGTTVRKPNLKEFDSEMLNLIKMKLLCNDSDSTTGACKHFGFLGGGWIGSVFTRS
ncbi:MAG: hypothetical protein LBK67_02920 [Coriobacteriales bacterium]|nr:hypothetical protein [Coriobacteriales bacterium]